MFRHLLVVVDDRPKAFRAVLMALRLGRCLGSRVTLVYVVRRLRDAHAQSPPSSREGVTRGDVLFARARRVAVRLGVDCACRFAFGYESDGMIAELTTRYASDLVIVPSVDDDGPLAHVRERETSTDVLVCP